MKYPNGSKFSASKFWLGSLALVALLGTAACDPKHDSVDERQAQINSANASLVRMNTLNDELAAGGISIDRPVQAQNRIPYNSRPDLLTAKQKLEEFVQQGRNVLTISTRADLAWGGDRRQIENRVASAQILLAQINGQLGFATMGDGQLSVQFWNSWSQCRTSLNNGFELYGFRVWHTYSSYDERSFNNLDQARRRKLAKRIREQMACEQTYAQGNAQLYGPVYKTEVQVTDVPEQFRGQFDGQFKAQAGRLKAGNDDLEKVVKKLDASDEAGDSISRK